MKMRPSVDLYWLPLGAGGHSVRLNGRVFEAVVARVEKRPAKDLYHSALIVNVPEGEFVIEQAPVGSGNGALRGVVAEGAVGTRWARSLRVFRYEIRRWRGGVIPDAGEAVDSPQRLTDDLFLARRVLELVPDVPTPVWGRDELQAGEMWNSNSLISWLIARRQISLVSKTVSGSWVRRGFKSLPLRLLEPKSPASGLRSALGRSPTHRRPTREGMFRLDVGNPSCGRVRGRSSRTSAARSVPGLDCTDQLGCVRL
jgi:hypothetical protein